MASSSSNKAIKRQRSSGSDNEEEDNKKQRLNDKALALSSELVKSINVEWSREGATKRARSKSNEPTERNVRARMSVDLSSSNPEPASFLMGTISNELEAINQMLSPGVSGRSVGAISSSSPASPSSSPGSPSSSTGSPSSSSGLPSSNASHSNASSLQSSPDYYDRLVMEGFEVLDRMRQDPFYKKYL